MLVLISAVNSYPTWMRKGNTWGPKVKLKTDKWLHTYKSLIHTRENGVGSLMLNQSFGFPDPYKLNRSWRLNRLLKCTYNICGEIYCKYSVCLTTISESSRCCFLGLMLFRNTTSCYLSGWVVATLEYMLIHESLKASTSYCWCFQCLYEGKWCLACPASDRAFLKLERHPFSLYS